LFPVSHRGDGHGVVMVCDRVPDRLGARQADAVSFIAAAAGLLVSHAQEVAEARRLAAQLQHALDSRVLVEQAKGYVAGRDGHDIGTAFRVLREKARSERRPLADVAKETLPGV
ncbi:MAG: ANTAR domain-containing protein, partial [Actinomycetes bacterium]